jgi:hypothetical protein
LDFTLPLKAFLQTHFDVKALNGSEKFLALSALQAKGLSVEVTQLQVKKAWSKTVMKIAYNPSQQHRAMAEGWLTSTGKGSFIVTQQGYTYLEELQTHQAPIGGSGITKLDIFSVGKTHNFDKFLRSVFAAALNDVMIADSYVDETVFDNLLDQIPETVAVSLLYGNKQGTFDARAKRFKGQYPKFTAKQHSSLHDRFLIVDEIGYIIGPSLKDAARKSPATVVSLGSADSKKLKHFFMEFWTQAK